MFTFLCRSRKPSPQAARVASRRPGFRPRLELLEDRLAPATLMTLASFTSGTGTGPGGGMVMDSQGNLFGTTVAGGTDNYGTVFEVAAGSGVPTTLASFTGDDNGGNGRWPTGDLVMDSQGNLYGTTQAGGTSPLGHGVGTVFELPNGSNTITDLVTFYQNASGYPLGATPFSGLYEDSQGSLFGTTSFGGVAGTNPDGSPIVGEGTAFEIVSDTRAFTQLAVFNTVINAPAGQNPADPPIEDSNGNLFGMTTWGPSFPGQGTVYELTPSGSLSGLASFNGPNGANGPSGANDATGRLIMDNQGNLFGTTQEGGATWSSQDSGYGTVFEIANGSHTITTLASFDGRNDPAHGYNPSGGLVMDSQGNLFGTTFGGGQYGYGTVFEIANGSHTITTLVSFNYNGGDGAGPIGDLVMDGSGNLFGVTANGGATGNGTVFEVVRSTTWTGLGTNNNWSNPANWTAGVPGTGVIAAFSTPAGSSTAVLDVPFQGVLNIDSNWGGTINVNQPLTTSGIDQWASGTINVASGVTWTNTGTLTLSGTNLTLSGPGTLSDANTLIVAGGTTFTDSGRYHEAGTLQVQSGATATLSGAFDNYNGTGTLTGGTYDLLGTLQFANAALVTNAANLILDGPGAQVTGLNGNDALGPSLAGNAAGGHLSVLDGYVFTTAADFTNNGTLTVGAGSGFNVSGNFTQGASATLEIQLGGTGAGNFGQLAVTGNATLAGTLAVTLVGGYVPTSGDTFPVLTYARRSGAFATGPAGFSLNYDDPDGILTVIKQ